MSVKSSTETQLLTTLKKGVDNNLPQLSGFGKIVLESAALSQISLASLRVAPYVFLAKELEIGGVANFFNSRGTYLEATLISLASLVYQTVMLFFYSILVVGTLGTSDTINESCKKHWIHLVYAGASIGVGLVGMAAPLYGSALNAGLLYYSIQVLKRAYYADQNANERTFINEIRSLYIKNLDVIKKLFQAKVPEHRYLHEFEPSLEYIKREMNKVGSISEFNSLVEDIWLRFPRQGLANST